MPASPPIAINTRSGGAGCLDVLSMRLDRAQ